MGHHEHLGTFPYLYIMLAGCRAEAVFRCVDKFGNLLQEGGATLEGHCLSLAQGMLSNPQPCEVADRGNGLYALSCCLQAAGPFEVSLNPECCQCSVKCCRPCRPCTIFNKLQALCRQACLVDVH